MSEKSLKVIYLHQYFETPGEFGGLRSYKNALHLVKKGHTVTVISGAKSYHTGTKNRNTKPGYEREKIDGISVIWLNTFFSYHKTYYHRLMSFAAYMFLATWAGLRSRPNVVYATSPPLTVIIPGLVISKLKKAKLIFEVRDIWPESAITTGVLRNPFLIWIAHKLEKFAHLISDRIVPVSDGIGDALVSSGVPSWKIRVIPHGADIEYFPKGEYDEQFRTGYNLEGKFVAIYAGSFGWANGLEHLIKAAHLLRDFDRIRIVLLGDGKEKKRLDDTARQYRADNVVFANPVPKREVGKIISTADVGLMILRNSKTFATVLPNKLLDYLAAGLPVIINFEGFASRVVERAGAGLLVGPDSAEDIARALVRLSATSTRCRSMGLRGREYVEKHYSREVQVRKFEKVVAEVLEV